MKLLHRLVRIISGIFPDHRHDSSLASSHKFHDVSAPIPLKASYSLCFCHFDSLASSCPLYRASACRFLHVTGQFPCVSVTCRFPYTPCSVHIPSRHRSVPLRHCTDSHTPLAAFRFPHVTGQFPRVASHRTDSFNVTMSIL